MALCLDALDIIFKYMLRSLKVPCPKITDRRVIRLVVGRQDPEDNILLAVLGNLGGRDAATVSEEQDSRRDFRMVRGISASSYSLAEDVSVGSPTKKYYSGRLLVCLESGGGSATE